MFVVLLGMLSLASAAPALFQSGSAVLSSNVLCTSVLSVSSVRGGDVIVVGVDAAASSAFTFSISDSQRNVYRPLQSYGSLLNVVNNFNQVLYMTKIATTGTWNLTVCSSRLVNAGEIYFAEYSGISDVDTSSYTLNVTSPPPPAGVYESAPIQANCPGDLLFQFAVAPNGIVNPRAPMSQIRPLMGNFIADRILTSPGSYVTPFSFDGAPPGWVVMVATFISSSVQCSSVLSGQTVTLTGDVTILAPVINGTIIVIGNGTLPSATVLGSSAVIQISGNALLSSSIVVTQGAQLIVGGSVTFASGASIAPVVTSVAPTVTLVLANFSSAAGTPTVGNAVFSPSVDSACASITSSQPIVGSTSLTVVVSISTSACGTTAPAGGLSTGAIIGIAVGAGVGGLLVVAGIVILTVYCIKRRDMSANRAIRGKGVGVDL